MILCVTPNVAVDRTMRVPDFEKGGVIRATEIFVAAGGKGLNVARAIQILNGTTGEATRKTPLNAVRCAGFLGGHSGRLVAEMTAQEGLPAAWTWIEAETRTCVIVITSNNHDATVFNEPGPTISAADWSHLRADVMQAATEADCVCLSGSLPLGAPADAPADLIHDLRQAGAPVWVDTSKTALRIALTAHPTGIKVNAAEAGDVLGRTVNDVETAFEVATTIFQMGISMVVLTLGQQGAVMVTEAGCWWAAPSDVQVISSVGSGDAFLAGLVTGLVAGISPVDALCRAIAVGTANTLQAGGGSFSLQDFEAVLGTTAVKNWG